VHWHLSNGAPKAVHAHANKALCIAYVYIFYTSALQTERRLQRMLPVPDVRLFESLRPTENVFIIFILRSNEMLKKKLYIYIYSLLLNTNGVLRVFRRQT
jgi:hypothetical protein